MAASVSIFIAIRDAIEPQRASDAGETPLCPGAYGTGGYNDATVAPAWFPLPGKYIFSNDVGVFTCRMALSYRPTLNKDANTRRRVNIADSNDFVRTATVRSLALNVRIGSLKSIEETRKRAKDDQRSGC